MQAAAAAGGEVSSAAVEEMQRVLMSEQQKNGKILMQVRFGSPYLSDESHSIIVYFATKLNVSLCFEHDQLVVLTNELNERDNQIALLKKKETHFEQTIQERENLFKQDTMVRMQLGKRLEQVLMDKEEALDQLDALRVSTPQKEKPK